MSKTPFMRLWVGDFLGDTHQLDAQHIGAYMLILMTMWQAGGTLPYDHDKLRRYARVKRRWPEIWSAIEGYFIIENGTISNARLTEERRLADHKTTIRRHIGGKGGRAKALKNKKVDVANGTDLLEQNAYQSDIRDTLVTSSLRSEITNDAAASQNLFKNEVIPDPPDPKKVLFDYGIFYLGQHGTKESQARSIIGKWASNYTVEEISRAIKTAKREGVVAPIPYIQKALAAGPSSKDKTKPVPLYVKLGQKED